MFYLIEWVATQPRSVSYRRFGCKAEWKKVNFYISIAETSSIFSIYWALAVPFVICWFCLWGSSESSQLSSKRHSRFLPPSFFWLTRPWWQRLVSPPPLICSHSSSVLFRALLPHAATSVWKRCTCAVEGTQPEEKTGSTLTSLLLLVCVPGCKEVHTLLQPSQTLNVVIFAVVWSASCCFHCLSCVLIWGTVSCRTLLGFREGFLQQHLQPTLHVLMILIITAEIAWT